MAQGSRCQCTIRVFHHRLKDLHLFSLKHYTRLVQWRSGRKLCFGQLQVTNQDAMPWHSHIWSEMAAAILPQVFSPATRTQCQNMGNKIMVPTQPLWSPKTTALVRRYSTGSLSATMGKVIHYIPDFLDPYFYFVLNFIWVFFIYDREAISVQECSWFRVIDTGKQDGFNFCWLLWFTPI